MGSRTRGIKIGQNRSKCPVVGSMFPHPCVHACTHIHIHTHTHIRIYIYTYVYIYNNTYMYAHTYIYTHM